MAYQAIFKRYEIKYLLDEEQKRLCSRRWNRICGLTATDGPP